VICRVLYDFGLMSDEIYAADQAFGQSLPRETRRFSGGTRASFLSLRRLCWLGLTPWQRSAESSARGGLCSDD
jgi:hypothetical protein